ncbi:MAG: pantoate--beta-alanine ligase [Bacteroidales bacterium]
MEVYSTVNELREKLSNALVSEQSIGFVPTMGALHEGHLSLLERARRENDISLVSIFVNPTQFNDKEDLARYPRTLGPDLEKLEKAGCNLVFNPSVEEIYPPGYHFSIDLGTLDTVMEGKQRPGHFAGVASVVNRLFQITTPTRAYFGEKDYQQLAVIHKLVKDKAIPVRIVPCPIIREQDGLAMSSRNMLLDNNLRKSAPRISQVLFAAKNMNRSLSLKETEEWVIREIDKDPLLKTEYFCIVHAITLESSANWLPAETMVGCVAVKAGKIRLIDNVKFLA